jgi:hypothetical protein
MPDRPALYFATALIQLIDESNDISMACANKR